MELLQGVIAWFRDPEHWEGPNGVPARLVEHVGLSSLALLIACLLAIPLGLWLGHTGRGGTVAINLTNIGRAVPTFAVLSLLALGPLGLSTASTVVALVLFAVPPLLTSTYVGMREVDRDAVEAAIGMGMGGGQVLRGVELPLAAPLLMSGVRLAGVQVVATATIAALVGGGGLGRIITSGFARQDQAQVVAGALLVAALALVTELLLTAAQRRTDPLRSARAARVRTPGVPDPALDGVH
jgi:osmoprotectant transport system permease protein